jgi:hypothetical protein
MLPVDLLLGNDLETTSAAKEQILNKQVYAAVAGNALANRHFPTETIVVQQWTGHAEVL